ncbi:hypothetical protein [Methylomonas methanica]|uniref:Uncharacterized protein n=1 Tax=Methylomonas methanica (strain DSM 25384 / MC09) TaxID=857087 RepID=G0A666_METMM|nr:hypothetical protein [Methylomonas methanica]AEG00516.1 hypothetical protein Metme_2111 [Methylomonas methanica MC09]
MSIKSVDNTTPNAIQQRHLIQSPGKNFFTDFKAAYARYELPSTTASESSVSDPQNQTPSVAGIADVMGLTFSEMAAVRGTSTQDQNAYAAILNRAYSQGGMDDPVAFLNSLTKEEQGVVQRAHLLVDPVEPSTMSKEGAYNLLLPDGYQVDFNHDGIQEVGAGKNITFPPLDAPEQVKQAWLTATKDMAEGDMMTYQLKMHFMLYGVDINDQTGKALAPTDQIDSYRDGVDKFLAWLEYAKASIPAEQYARDKAFFSDMKRLLI